MFVVPPPISISDPTIPSQAGRISRLYSISMTDLTDLSVRHIGGNNLKINVFHGNNRKEVDSLGKYDVVITSFYTVSAIWRKQNDLQDPTKTIFSVRWHRIVLDEGEHFHYVIYSV
jgi:hypothetical protein